MIVKTDQEPSIGILVQDIKEMRESRTVIEESPVGSHQSNGIIERSVQGVEGQLRVLKSALEGRIGKRISAERRIVKFMAEYGAYLLNRLEVGKDGKTAYERVRGKKGRVLGVEFGEKLLWKVRPKEKLEKIQPRWEYGIFVGVKRKGGEVWVATKEGGMKAVRSVRRIPVEERWGEDCLDWVKNVPWNRGDGGETDGEIPEEKLEEPGERQEENEGLKGVVFVNTREKEPREFYISKEDGEKYGYTRGCGGCSSWFKGLGRQPHTEACRERFKELMKGAAKVKNAEKRKKEFEERVTKRKKEEKPEGVEVTVNPQGGRIQKGGASGSGVKRGGGDLRVGAGGSAGGRGHEEW